jgi:hypothetical protein
MQEAELYVVILIGSEKNQKWGRSLHSFPHTCANRAAAVKFVASMSAQRVWCKGMSLSAYEKYVKDIIEECEELEALLG